MTRLERWQLHWENRTDRQAGTQTGERVDTRLQAPDLGTASPGDEEPVAGPAVEPLTAGETEAVEARTEWSHRLRARLGADHSSYDDIIRVCGLLLGIPIAQPLHLVRLHSLVHRHLCEVVMEKNQMLR